MTAASQHPAYFDSLYADNPDPWSFETSEYERAKYAATLAALPKTRYLCALEVGCSIGVLTDLIATRCDSLLGIDVVPAALERAAVRCADKSHVRFAVSELPTRAPDGQFDLIILSEVLYYFDRDQLADIATKLLARSTADATFLLVHWLGPTPDYPLTGDGAVEFFEPMLGEAVVTRLQTQEYRIDLIESVRPSQ